MTLSELYLLALNRDSREFSRILSIGYQSSLEFSRSSSLYQIATTHLETAAANGHGFCYTTDPVGQPPEALSSILFFVFIEVIM
jgi:hypothetical protein